MQEKLNIDLPQWELLPDIGLYMDQVVTLMERTFSPTLPKGEMTKSMVNNYVKVGLIPRPVGKKYDREHLAMLLMICVLKQALSMESVGQLLDIMDYVSNSVMMPFIALLSTVLIGWVMTPDYVIDEMERNGETFRRKKLYRVMIRYVAPVMMFVLFLQSTGILSKIG